MEEGKMSEDILTSAVAFVEGGIQDASDDACSICLEKFCDSDPSIVTGCKHGFHLQCILEWHLYKLVEYNSTLYPNGPSKHNITPTKSMKSRLTAMSMRYKESLTKSSRDWKEKFFSRNSSMPDRGPESRNEVSAAVATVSHMMENLEITGSRTNSSESDILEDTSPGERAEHHMPETDGTHPLNGDNRQAPCAATSGSI